MGVAALEVCCGCVCGRGHKPHLLALGPPSSSCGAVECHTNLAPWGRPWAEPAVSGRTPCLPPLVVTLCSSFPSHGLSNWGSRLPMTGYVPACTRGPLHASLSGACRGPPD